LSGGLTWTIATSTASRPLRIRAGTSDSDTGTYSALFARNSSRQFRPTKKT
jgi:hypothetical protein